MTDRSISQRAGWRRPHPWSGTYHQSPIPAGAALAAVLAGLRLGAGQAPERAVQRAGRYVPVPLGVPEGAQPFGRFGLELPQLPFEFLDLPLQGFILAARAGDLALGRVEAGLCLAGVLGGFLPVALGGLGLLPCALGFRL